MDDLMSLNFGQVTEDLEVANIKGILSYYVN